MVVSERHRYAFLQFPQAASTAIGKELVDHYGGQRILRKHSTLHHFRNWAGDNTSEYFTFSSIRNPLDKIVSLYFKLKTDSEGTHQDPSNWKSNGGWISRRELRRFRYAQRRDVGFADYFRRFYWFPYVDWSALDHHKLDFVIRVERIEADFSEALSRIGLKPIRPLPIVNRTRGKGDEFEDVYPLSIRRRVVRVMGPMMRHSGYEFPEDWPKERISRTRLTLFRIIRNLKALYFRYIW